MMGHAVMMEYYHSLSDEERNGIHAEALRANPKASAQELIEVKRAALWKAIHKARKIEDHAEKDTSSLSLAGDEDVNQLYVRGPAQKALLDEFRLSITEEQRVEMYGKLSEEYPDANAKELAGNLRAVMVTAALEARRTKIQDEKDCSFPPSLSAGTGKPASPLSLQAQPKSDAPTSVNSGTLSLTKEERATVFEATKKSNPNAGHKAFNEAYGIALWKAENQKRGINSGGSLGAVDISLSSETDDKGDSGEDSDSSEDGLQTIRDDLLRQGQVSPPPSPKANRFLASLMKSPPKLQLEEQSRQNLDKEPLSLVSPTNQARLDSKDANLGRRTGDVTGQGGSVSASLGLSSLVSVDNAHQLDRQTAADTIRNGSLLSSPQPAEASRINSIASSQVEKSRNVPRARKESTPEERIARIESIALAKKKLQETMDRDTSPDSLSPESQAQRTKLLAKVDKELAEVKRLRDRAQERISVPPAENPSVPVPLIENPTGQRVLTETFFVNRLEEIRQFAGDAKLENFKNGFGR
jgi:hypothetical protein